MSLSVYRLMLIFAALVLLAVSRYLLPEDMHFKGSDEYYYLQYAQYVAEHGVQGVRDLVVWYSQSEENRYHPPPARLAYVFLAAFLVKTLGNSYSTLVCISYASLLIFCMASFYYARKLFSKEFAVCFLLVLCGSPLTLGMGCVALSDSFLNLSWGCAVWAFLDYLNGRSRGKLAVVVLFLTLSLLVKEASVLLIVFVAVFMLFFAPYLKLRVELKDLPILCFLPAVIALTVYWFVLGGMSHFSVLVKAMYLTHFVDKANFYATQFSSGPWYRYFVDFLLLSPVVTLMALGYAGHLVLARFRDAKKIYFLIYFLMIYIPLSLLQHTKVVRFVINLEMVMALFTAWAILEFFKQDIRRERWGKALLAVIVVFAVSFHSFFHIFAVENMLDPITYHLAMIQGFIPDMFPP